MRDGLRAAIEWHKHNAKICRDIANDHPSRYGQEALYKAEQAAKHHDASAAGLTQLLIKEIRKNGQN